MYNIDKNISKIKLSKLYLTKQLQKINKKNYQ